MKNSTGNEANVTRAVIVKKEPEVSKPTIQLTGGNSIEWEQGKPFSDPGYSAKAGDGENITTKVVVTGVVDVNVLGPYVLKYTVSDGGEEVSVTRTVTVIPAPGTTP